MNEAWYGNWLKNDCSGLNRNKGIGMKKEKQIIIPALRKLIARSQVFEGYTAQYELLQARQIKPSDFEQQLANLPESLLVEGYLILEPTEKEPAKATA